MTDEQEPCAPESPARRAPGRASPLQRGADAARSRDPIRPRFSRSRRRRTTRRCCRRSTTRGRCCPKARRRRGRPGWGTRIFNMVWPAIAPLFEQQMAFNAALVEHLNRNAAAHRDAHAALERALPALARRLRCARAIRIPARAISADDHAALRHALSRDRRCDHAIARGDGCRAADGDAGETRSGAPNEPGTGAPVQPVHRSRPATLHPSHPHAYQYVGFEDRFRGSESVDPRAARRLRVRTSPANRTFSTSAAAAVSSSTCCASKASRRRDSISTRRWSKSAARAGWMRRPPMPEVICRACRRIAWRTDRGAGHRAPRARLSDADAGAGVRQGPAGRTLVLETINPACWVAFFESFIRDLTHVKPIHPETLQYLLQASGFSNVEIVYRAPIAPEGRLQKVTARPEHFGDTAPDALTELVSSFNQQRRSVERSNVLVPGLRRDRTRP